jgi:hypothetical protein
MLRCKALSLMSVRSRPHMGEQEFQHNKLCFAGEMIRHEHRPLVARVAKLAKAHYGRALCNV